MKCENLTMMMMIRFWTNTKLLKRAFDRSLGELKFYESVAGILLVDL